MSARVLLVVVALAGLALLVVLVPLLRDPGAASRRVQALFRKPQRRPTPPQTDHYYRPYWS